MLGGPSSSRWRRLSRLSGPQLIERGIQLYKANRSVEAEADFAAARKRKGLTPEEKCKALFYQGSAWWKRRKRSKSAPLFEKAIVACAKTDLIEAELRDNAGTVVTTDAFVLIVDPI